MAGKIKRFMDNVHTDG